MKAKQCECCDPGCPAHEGKNECNKRARRKVSRYDMTDDLNRPDTFYMCSKCADDAIESGVFS